MPFTHKSEAQRQELLDFYVESSFCIDKKLASSYPLEPEDLHTLSTLEDSDFDMANVQKALENTNGPNLWIRILLYLAIHKPTALCWVLPDLYSSSLMPPDACMDVIICAYYHLANMGLRSSSIPEPFYRMLLSMVPRLGSGVISRLPIYALMRKCPAHLKSAMDQLIHDFGPANHWESNLRLSQALSSAGQFDDVKKCFVLAENTSFAEYSVEYYNSLDAFVACVEEEGRFTAQQVEDHLVQFIPLLKSGHPKSLRRLIKAAKRTGNLGIIHHVLTVLDRNRTSIRNTVLIRAILTLKEMNASLDITKYPGIVQCVSKNHQIATAIISTRRDYLESNGISKDIYNLLLPYFEMWFDSSVLQALGLPVSGPSDNSKLEPDSVTVMVMLDSYFAQSENEESVVRETYKRFNSALLLPEFNKILTGVGPDVFNVFINAFAMFKSIDIDVCLSIIGDINRHVTGGAEPLVINNVLVRKRHAGTDRVSLALLLMALSWGGHLKAAEAVLKQIWRQYPADFGNAGNVVISGYVGVGDERRALELATLRELIGFPSDDYTKRALSGASTSDEALLGSSPPSLG